MSYESYIIVTRGEGRAIIPERLVNGFVSCGWVVLKPSDDVAALKAEVERLRGALEDVTLFLDEGKESDAYEIVAQALSLAPSDPQPAKEKE